MKALFEIALLCSFLVALKPLLMLNSMLATQSALLASPSGDRQMSSWLEHDYGTGIRRWGCGRTETPLIFVHIGKAGGGTVRGRIAASSLNYTKSKFYQADGSYYPVWNGSGITKARFCNSCNQHYLPFVERVFEGNMPCNATTPLGLAIACPKPLNPPKSDLGCDDPASEHCHLVYVGHNFLGAEMHWLPARYLEKWWADTWGRLDTTDFSSLWRRLQVDQKWCTENNASRPEGRRYRAMYEKCSVPLQGEVDARALDSLASRLPREHSDGISWSPVYASLPVLRVTVVRDPFSWLVSKFFWHGGANQNYTCDEIQIATHGAGEPHDRIQMDDLGDGWAQRMSLGYIYYLCGEDCIVRSLTNNATRLEDLEWQAEGNLRYSFAVVGLMNETDTFFDMVSARVDYMNTSLNMHVKTSRHGTGKSKETSRCKARFGDPAFQQELMTVSPEIAALNRLYNVAVEVNRFQLRELQDCSDIF